MSDEPTQNADMYPEGFSLVSTVDGSKIAIVFRSRDAEEQKMTLVHVWLATSDAARLSAQLATLSRQFGVEPPTSRQTMQ